MSDYRPTELQMLENIWSRLKKIDAQLESIKWSAIIIAVLVAAYIWKH